METPDDNAPIPATQSLSAITQTRSLPARGEVGFMIGSYKVEKELGRGGMGVVYETVDENLHRRTALKVISPMLGINPEAIERLRNEARAVAKLNHPNIVSVYAFDYSEGLPFIAMEYVEGADLRQQCLRHGPMSAEVSLKYIRGAVAALGYAAKHRIIHRDIKPANIFLTNEGEIKVMDFGLAKELDVKSDLTGTGNTVGTPNYMSPEQVLAKPLDHRSDMYSLGCTLYTLLTGRLPFEAPSATEVMMSHVNSELAVPVDWKRVANGKLTKIIGKLTRKKPEDRYSTWDEVLVDVDDALANMTGSTMVSTPGLTAGRNPMPTAALIGAAIALAVIAIPVVMWMAGVFEGESRQATPEQPMTAARSGISNPSSFGESGTSNQPTISQLPANLPQSSATPFPTVAPPRPTPAPVQVTHNEIVNMIKRTEYVRAIQVIRESSDFEELRYLPMAEGLLLRETEAALDANGQFIASASFLTKDMGPQSRGQATKDWIHEKGKELSFEDAAQAVLVLIFADDPEALTYAKYLGETYSPGPQTGRYYSMLFHSAIFMTPSAEREWHQIVSNRVGGPPGIGRSNDGRSGGNRRPNGPRPPANNRPRN